MFSILSLKIWIIIFLSHILSTHAFTDEECLDRGFRRSELYCIRCEEFQKFDLKALKRSCLKCCQRDFDQSSKFSSARIELCDCPTHTVNFPQIFEFIKSNKIKKFPNLTVKTVKGSDPVIKLINSKGIVVKELNINKWDTDTIEEFLTQRLIKVKK